MLLSEFVFVFLILQLVHIVLGYKFDKPHICELIFSKKASEMKLQAVTLDQRKLIVIESNYLYQIPVSSIGSGQINMLTENTKLITRHKWYYDEKFRFPNAYMERINDNILSQMSAVVWRERNQTIYHYILTNRIDLEMWAVNKQINFFYQSLDTTTAYRIISDLKGNGFIWNKDSSGVVFLTPISINNESLHLINFPTNYEKDKESNKFIVTNLSKSHFEIREFHKRFIDSSKALKDYLLFGFTLDDLVHIWDPLRQQVITFEQFSPDISLQNVPYTRVNMTEYFVCTHNNTLPEEEFDNETMKHIQDTEMPSYRVLWTLCSVVLLAVFVIAACFILACSRAARAEKTQNRESETQQSTF